MPKASAKSMTTNNVKPKPTARANRSQSGVNNGVLFRPSGVGIAGALFHHFSFGRTFFSNLFGIGNQRPVNLDPVPLAQSGVELT